MIDVVCFCGCAYSFIGDAGTCPGCDEETSFTHRPAGGPRQESAELEQLIRRPYDVPPEELAA